jgi:hypothetical protein
VTTSDRTDSGSADSGSADSGRVALTVRFGAVLGAAPDGAALAAAAGLRAAYGAALCCAPGAMLRLEGGAGASCAPHARAVAQVLGGRHLAQAFLSAARPAPAILALSAGTDMLHSASMVALGVLDRPRRRLGLTDGLIAAAFAAVGWALARQRRAGADPAAARLPGRSGFSGGSDSYKDLRMTDTAMPSYWS